MFYVLATYSHEENFFKDIQGTPYLIPGTRRGAGRILVMGRIARVVVPKVPRN
jgi:hypothetical protein